MCAAAIAVAMLRVAPWSTLSIRDHTTARCRLCVRHQALLVTLLPRYTDYEVNYFQPILFMSTTNHIVRFADILNMHQCPCGERATGAGALVVSSG
jgi:hypothetical protein